MPSISQQPATGQQMPPPVVEVGPTKQQIDQAVREHVAKNRAQSVASAANVAILEGKLKDAQRRLDSALEQMKLAQDMFHQSSLLFRAIYSGMKNCPDSDHARVRALVDAMAFADLGWRESDCWEHTMQTERECLGEAA